MSDPLTLARLLRLASPALPIGAFSYSQALEWATEAGQVRDEASARNWIAGILLGPLARCECPVLCRMIEAWQRDDLTAVDRLNAFFLASRETMEFRAESLHLGQALTKALRAAGDVSLRRLDDLESLTRCTYPAAFACAMADWQVRLESAVTAYVWAWLENQVTAAIKLVPLGQSGGQRLLSALSRELPGVVSGAIRCAEDDISNFAPLLAIASSRHETQYTRLFRS